MSAYPIEPDDTDSTVNRQLSAEPGNPGAGRPAPARRSPRSRRREPVETDAYLAFVVRIIRAAGRRIADGDVEDLPDLLNLQREVDQALQVAVDGLHHDLGFSYGEIAARIGTTRQNVQKRWGGMQGPGGDGS